MNEVESGELRWPPENTDMEEDEEDLFLEQCIPPANIADWGEEEEEEEETSVILNQQQGLTLIGELCLGVFTVYPSEESIQISCCKTDDQYLKIKHENDDAAFFCHFTNFG